MGLFNSKPATAGPTLNLGTTVSSGPSVTNPWAQQAPVGGAFTQGLAASFGQQHLVQQPVAPPSEMEFMVALLNATYPMERWVSGHGFQAYVEMMSSMMELVIVEFFKNAKFTVDEDTGTMSLDTSSLPNNLQTISSENIVSEFAKVRADAEKVKTDASALQDQIINFTKQSMLGTALDSALADPGFLQRAGQGVGALGRGLIGMK